MWTILGNSGSCLMYLDGNGMEAACPPPPPPEASAGLICLEEACPRQVRISPACAHGSKQQFCGGRRAKRWEFHIAAAWAHYHVTVRKALLAHSRCLAQICITSRPGVRRHRTSFGVCIHVHTMQGVMGIGPG